MQVELESAEFQKQMLKNKLNDLNKEINSIRKENVKGIITRSISPKTAAEV